MSFLTLPRPRIRTLLAALAPLALGGCNFEVLFPAGDIARQQAHILAISTVLMLLIIIPVMALTVLFAWKYRSSNTQAVYKPDWDHSTILELIIWSAPLLIIIALGALTWISTHTLDPYRRLDRLAPGKPIAAGSKPFEIDVVALDWKWLFIYPEQGVATVNELALPVNREIQFRITAGNVMNSFYIPSLAGQIYAMPGMETKLHAVLNRTGKFDGFSANYSGAGFSGMHFTTTGMDDKGFAAWIETRKKTGGHLDAKSYQVLARPSEYVKPLYWSSVDPDLFRRATEMCVAPGQPCTGDVMRHDMGPAEMAGMKSEASAADTKAKASPAAAANPMHNMHM